MSYSISLKIQPPTYQSFIDIHQKLNNSSPENVAKLLGDNLADITCEIVDQVFGNLAKISSSYDAESEKVVQHITATTRKYMPWSVSFFSNDRLVPLVNYLHSMFVECEGHYFIHYPVDKTLIIELLACIDHIQAGNNQYVVPALKAFVKVVDEGVTHLIREPKKMLKFNMVVDKTLNGVIHVTTQLGYKRFDKLGMMYDASVIHRYFEHFLAFLNTEK